MKDEWVNVHDDMPQVQDKNFNTSIMCKLFCISGRTATGYFNYNREKWYNRSNRIINGVVAWQTLG